MGAGPGERDLASEQEGLLLSICFLITGLVHWFLLFYLKYQISKMTVANFSNAGLLLKRH